MSIMSLLCKSSVGGRIQNVTPDTANHTTTSPHPGKLYVDKMSALGRGWRRPLTAAFGSDERSGLAGCHRWWAAFICGLGIVTELLTGLAELVTVLIPAVGNLFHTNDVQIQGKRIQSVEAAIWTTSARWLRVYALLMGLGSA